MERTRATVGPLLRPLTDDDGDDGEVVESSSSSSFAVAITVAANWSCAIDLWLLLLFELKPELLPMAVLLGALVMAISFMDDVNDDGGVIIVVTCDRCGDGSDGG